MLKSFTEHFSISLVCSVTSHGINTDVFLTLVSWLGSTAGLKEDETHAIDVQRYKIKRCLVRKYPRSTDVTSRTLRHDRETILALYFVCLFWRKLIWKCRLENVGVMCRLQCVKPYFYGCVTGTGIQIQIQIQIFYWCSHARSTGLTNEQIQYKKNAIHNHTQQIIAIMATDQVQMIKEYLGEPYCSLSLDLYIFKTHLQQLDTASRGQWRSRMYFSLLFKLRLSYE